MRKKLLLLGLSAAIALPAPAAVLFSTGAANNGIATASRPGPPAGPNQETESADDFLFSTPVLLTGASFTGLVPLGVNVSTGVSQIVVELYNIFPLDSNTVRTPNVPTRANSPSDVEFVSRDSGAAGLTFATTVLNASFTALNSVDLGIHPSPGQTTLGEGPVTGQEVRFDVTFTTPISLAAGHYFFIPQVLLSNPNNHFLWLSGERPIVTGTPINPDLQSWIRNASLDPDWLRVGTDVVGTGTFNGDFTLIGNAVPEPGTFLTFGMAALLGIGSRLRRRRA